MTFTPTTNDPLIGKILAERYRITELVGAGRFSIVYKGQHLFMDRSVAMKTLQSNLVEDQTIIKRFEKEAVALSKLRHPNIVSVYDCFVHTNGQPFLVMDFLDGHTLEELLNDRGAIPPKLMRAIIFQASAGLAHAHQSGVLHRDIKPDNIILLPREKTDERVRLLDFGFALLQGDLERLTLSGTLCGSPAYISPERWKGKELDARSDIYSLAVVMFQGLTGQLPFKASSLEELRNMHVSQEPPKIGDILPALKEDEVAHQILSKALAKDPNDRYQTMKDFHNAIKLWSPNSDDAEIAQWAKNAGPKPSPTQTPGQPTQAQPVSLQPMPSQAVPPQGQAPAQQAGQSGSAQQAAAAGGAVQPGAAPQVAAAGAAASAGAQAIQQGSFSAPPGVGQAATLKTFDDATTLPNKQTAPAFDDSASLPKAEAIPAAEAPTPMGADQKPPAKGYVAVDINSHPLSPEALAKIPKPNPRASLTKMDVAYIKAIAQTLGDSLGDEAKSIEITPELEEELSRAPREETTKLDFKSMPPPVDQSTVPQPGPKIIPVVDRRQNRQGETSSDEHDTLSASTWPAPDMSQSLVPASKPFGAGPGGGPGAPAQPPKPVAAPGQPAQTAAGQPNQPGQPSPAAPMAPAAKAPEQPVPADWSAKQAVVPERPEQPVPADWTAKQEVAPWVQNPDDFKPRSGDFALPGQSPAASDNQPASPPSFGAPPTFPTGATSGAPGAIPGSPGAFPGSPSGPSAGQAPGAPPNAGTPQQAPSTPGFGANAWAPQTGPVFGQAPPGITAVGGTEVPKPSKDSTVSSSRISPVLPGSPSPDADAPGSVPWTNATSSSPVDFGKIFGDNTLINNQGMAASIPSTPVMPDMQGGTEVASPTASSANLSVASGERSAPPKSSKKRGRLPTFVDRDIDMSDGEGAVAPPAKKGGPGMLIAGVAVAVFIFAGIGIATWLLTNVNPSTSPTTENATQNSATSPTDGNTPAATSPTTTDSTAAATGANDTNGTATETPKPSDTATTEQPSTISDDGTAETVIPASKPEPVAKTATATAKPAPAKPPVTASKAPPSAAPKKEEHSTGGWFGFPSFNQNKEAEKKEPAPVTANQESAKPAAPPKKKKKKPKKIPVAHKAAPAASSGGYVEVEVSPSRRAYRSY